MELLEKTAHNGAFCLMVWEVNPKLRNKHNEIQFNLRNDIDLKIGDVLTIQTGTEFSCYEIEEILIFKESNIAGKNHVTAKTRWFPMTMKDREPQW